MTHGTAHVEDDCSEETLKALDEMSKLAYEKFSKPLNIDNVSNSFYCKDESINGADKCKSVCDYCKKFEQ